MTGSTFLTLLIAGEVAGLVFAGLKLTRIDYFAHLGGYAAGIVGTWVWKERRRKERRERGPFGGR